MRGLEHVRGGGPGPAARVVQLGGSGGSRWRWPPATSTLPSGSSVAVLVVAGLVYVPVALQDRCSGRTARPRSLTPRGPVQPPATSTLPSGAAWPCGRTRPRSSPGGGPRGRPWLNNGRARADRWTGGRAGVNVVVGDGLGPPTAGWPGLVTKKAVPTAITPMTVAAATPLSDAGLKKAVDMGLRSSAPRRALARGGARK